MKEQTLAIPIDKIKSDFQLFLTPEHNRRIIFSGPFGIGKTYFLNEFFKEKTEYFPIFLRPVNYSLLTNEDIFKLIKYGILAELINEKEFNIDDEFDFSKAEYLKLFLNENKFLILRNLLKAIPKIRNIVSAVDDFEKLISKYKEGLDKINSDPSLEMLKQFQQDSENNFLLEYDEVSEYISSMLEEIVEAKKQREEKLKKVLIIDDLDRLDPEHIFRLFNVFSAHFDQVHYYENKKDNDNKFGFDKIIFVCDIENIRKIFAHKYGAEVDFSGYLDKFYSTEIYNFLHDDVFESLIKPYFENRFVFYHAQNRELETNELFVFILSLLFKGRELSVREIIRLGQYKPSFISDNKIVNHIPVMLTKMGSKENSILKQYDLLVLMKLFFEVLGGSEIFIKKMNNAFLKISETEDSSLSYKYKRTLNNLILFAEVESHRFEYSKRNEQNKKEYELVINGNQVVKYNLTGGYYSEHYEEGEMWFRIDVYGLENLKLTNSFFYSLLIKAIKGIILKGIIQ